MLAVSQTYAAQRRTAEWWRDLGREDARAEATPPAADMGAFLRRHGGDLDGLDARVLGIVHGWWRDGVTDHLAARAWGQR